LRGISITSIARDRLEDVYIVTAKATAPDGRTDESIGAVNIGGLKGDALANALMKAETKAKRRVTLSICGLGWSDETEVETIPGAKQVIVDSATGEIKQEAPQIEAGKTTTTEPPAQAESQSWTTDANTLKGFWANWKAKGLTEDDVHLNLNVMHLKDYTGSMGDAAKILQCVADKKAATKKA
jgi:DNA-directed RNA polymerase beta' subunit